MGKKVLKTLCGWFKSDLLAKLKGEQVGCMEPHEEIVELKRQIERLTVFHEIGKALASTIDLQKILQTVMEKISDHLQPDTWSLLMIDEATNELYFEIAIGAGADKLKDVRLKMGEGIAGWVAEHGEPVLIEDVKR